MAGHFGVGLALKARYRSVPLLPILIASLLPDWLFLMFYFAGWETLRGENQLFHPTQFAAIPFSHDVSMVAMYAGLCASVGLLLWSSRWALAMGWAVASHVVLDWLVHAPDIGVVGPWVPVRIGLDLWRRAPYVAWGLEFALVLGGGMLYLRGCRRTARAWAVPGVLVALQVVALRVW